jgi:hypothetical protein
MDAGSVYGVLCRILWLSSLAFENGLDTNQISIELSTPASLAPHGIGLCFTNSAYIQKQQSLSVVSLQEQGGGSWRELLQQQPQPANSWRSSSFFSNRNGLQDPIEVGTATALLSSDSFFDSSYAVAK